jgi:hypothetical protein
VAETFGFLTLDIFSNNYVDLNLICIIRQQFLQAFQ